MIADSNRLGSNFVNEEAATDVPGEPRKQTTFQKQFCKTVLHPVPEITKPEIF